MGGFVDLRMGKVDGGIGDGGRDFGGGLVFEGGGDENTAGPFGDGEVGVDGGGVKEVEVRDGEVDADEFGGLTSGGPGHFVVP